MREEGFLTPNPEDPTRPDLKAFAPGPFGGLVRVAQEGRDFRGQVAPGEESEVVREELRDRLEALEDPETGEPFVERVFTREELFSGPYLENAPDLLFLEKETRFVGRGTVALQDVFGPPSYTFSGFHRPEGVILVSGPSFPPREERVNVSILDVAPTIYWLFDVEAPGDLDGRVPAELVGEESLGERPPRTGERRATILPEDALSLTDSEREALESIGYVRLTPAGSATSARA